MNTNNHTHAFTQHDTIKLHIGRTRFNTKRAVEALQHSLLHSCDLAVSVTRGKLGEIELAGEAWRVFQAGMFILEDIVLRERPVLYPLVALSFSEHEHVEYFFLPSVNYHATFRPKNENSGNPIIFIKKLSKSNSTFLTQFVSSAQNPSIWSMSKIRYDLISEEASTIREDDKLEFILFVGSNTLEIQHMHHQFTTCFLSHMNPNLAHVATSNIVQLPTTTPIYHTPLQLCTYEMRSGNLLLNSNNLSNINSKDLTNTDLNVNYDQIKSTYLPPIDATVDPLLDQLMTALYYSHAGQLVLRESAAMRKPIILGMREIFSKIACTPYTNDDPKSSYEFVVSRSNGIISISSPSSSTSLVDKLSYHNHQFAKQCTQQNTAVKDRGNIWSHQFLDSSSDLITTGQLHEFTKFCTIVKSNIGRHNVVIGGQVDAHQSNSLHDFHKTGLPGINDITSTQPLHFHNIENVSLCATFPRFDLSQYIEIKTCGSLEETAKEHYKRETLHPLFMQSHLLGTKKILQGFVDKEKKGLVKKVIEQDTNALIVDPNMVDTSMSFLENVLNMLEEHTRDGSNYILLFAPPSSHVSLLSASMNEPKPAIINQVPFADGVWAY